MLDFKTVEEFAAAIGAMGHTKQSTELTDAVRYSATGGELWMRVRKALDDIANDPTIDAGTRDQARRMRRAAP